MDYNKEGPIGVPGNREHWPKNVGNREHWPKKSWEQGTLDTVWGTGNIKILYLETDKMGLKLLEIRNFGLKTSRTGNIRLKMPKIGNVYLKMLKTGNIGLKMLFFRIWEHWLEIPGNREHWPKKRREQGTLTPPIRASSI